MAKSPVQQASQDPSVTDTPKVDTPATDTPKVDWVDTPTTDTTGWEVSNKGDVEVKIYSPQEVAEALEHAKEVVNNSNIQFQSQILSDIDHAERLISLANA